MFMLCMQLSQSNSRFATVVFIISFMFGHLRVPKFNGRHPMSKLKQHFFALGWKIGNQNCSYYALFPMCCSSDPKKKNTYQTSSVLSHKVCLHIAFIPYSHYSDITEKQLNCTSNLRKRKLEWSLFSSNLRMFLEIVCT